MIPFLIPAAWAIVFAGAILVLIGLSLAAYDRWLR